MLNQKARFETLCNTKTNEIVTHQGLNYKFKNLVKQVKVNGMDLFLALEQGSGKNSNNTHVV